MLFNKIRDRNRYRGRGTKFPLWIVQFILEQLVNVTPKTSIYQNIVSNVSLTMPPVEVKKLPGIRFVRK